ncbi:MAG: delta-60 repeat domain-containing protein [Chitinophagales bacterium]
MKVAPDYLRLLALITGILLMTSVLLHAQTTPRPDATFGTGGQVLTKIKTSNDDISLSVAIQPDGKIVVAGNSHNLPGSSDMTVVRYKKNGQLDKSFNESGKWIVKNTFCNIVAIQQDGKIVVGGSKSIGSSFVFDVWRLNADGSIDNGFGNNGEQTIMFSGYVICFAMTIQPDGKILIGGNDGNFNAGNTSLVIARLNPDGQPDNIFSGDGKYEFKLPKNGLSCHRILVQPDGKIIVAGQLDTIVDATYKNEFFALRMFSDGGIDSSFGNNGIFRKKNSNSDNCFSAGLLPDGKIILAGSSQFTGYKAASVLGLNANGTVDNTFGSNGWLYPNFFGNAGAIINSMALQDDGKFILAGQASYSIANTTAIALARVNGNGTMDLTFGTGGVDTSFVSPSGTVACNDVALMTNGKIVLTGYQLQAHDYFMTARYLNDIQSLKSDINPEQSSRTDRTIFPVPVRGSNVALSFDLGSCDHILIRKYDFNNFEITDPLQVLLKKERQRLLCFCPMTFPEEFIFACCN